MKNLELFEGFFKRKKKENSDVDKALDIDLYTKLQFCRKCDEQTKHLDDRCLICKKKRETENEKEKKFNSRVGIKKRK